MAFVDNRPTPVQAADVGIKISKPFFNAATTQPQNLIFSSSWPSLPIAFEVNIPDATALAQYSSSFGVYKIPHNLGFPPLTFYWQKSDLSGKAGLGDVFVRSVADVDTNNVYLKAPFSLEPTAAVTPPINIKCFALDLSVDADYASPPGDTFKAGYDPDFGIKVSRPGKDVASKDLRDFVLHSRCQSPLIVAVKTERTASPSNPTVVQYTSKLPYPVWVYGFARSITGAGAPNSNSDYYQAAPYFSQAFPVTTTDGTVSYVSFGAAAAGASLVILRDPMFSSTQVTAQY